MRKAVYAGSFDPLTQGHLWMVEEGLRLFDELTVAIGSNPAKHYTFTEEQRLDMLQSALPEDASLKIDCFDNRYLVDYATERGATYILRGIRSPADYEYERVMRHINEDLRAEITTVFLMPPRAIVEVSSSMVKSMVGPTGWEAPVSGLVPEGVMPYLQSVAGRLGGHP